MIIGQLRHMGIGLDQRIAEFQWMPRREANAPDTIDLRQIINQQCQIGSFAGMHGPTVTVDVLPQTHILISAYALFGQRGDFGNHIVKWTANFLATCV